MTLTYKLNRNVVNRVAAQLTWELNSINSCISIINKNRMINGKSLVGILSGNLENKDEIKVIIDKDQELNKVRKSFDKIGKEI